MLTNIAINGFGRIGRTIFRLAMERPNIRVIAINDLISLDYLAYLLKYDSTHGRFSGDIQIEDNRLRVNGHQIRLSQEKNPKDIPWKQEKEPAPIVIESTGFFTKREQATLHLNAGAQRVIISAPSPDIPMFVMGVNHTNFDEKNDFLVSNASCTTNCITPLAKLLHDEWEITEGLMTTVHASTSMQKVLDAPSERDWRGGRSALQNIIPTSTGAAKAVGKIIPELDGKLTGISFRIPTPNVSIMDLTVRVKKATTYEEIKAKIKAASREDRWEGIIGYCDEPLVSTDILGDTRTSIFDAQAGLGVNPHFYKIISWYDNETGYSSKVLDLLEYVNSKIS